VLHGDLDAVRFSAEVADALAERRPVVALESTVFSLLGLPAPHNAEALTRSLSVIRSGGATPAVTAVVDGTIRVGIEEADHERILTADAKVAERDLPVAAGLDWPVGVTTVSASLAIAARAGIRVFATGGIGGVHRDVDHTGDVSADLAALARHRVCCVSAGAKSFLDLPRTLEMLETLGVPVIGFGTDHFPAFWVRSSGIPLTHRVDDPAAAAAVAAHATTGVLVTNPCPEADALAAEIVDGAIAEALAEAEKQGVRGGAVTPLVLARVAAATGGATLPANVALVESNARVATLIATTAPLAG
jgi:pseudouridine-5'-phosphate glycosidase